MTDTIPQPLDVAALMQTHDAWTTEADKLLLANKIALLGHLASTGITRVTVIFDGGGDSGQIEEIEARRDDQPAALPEGEIGFRDLSYGDHVPEARSISVAQAIEEICYTLLSQKHYGWENCDGAYGEFVFDIVASTITLDFNARYMASEHHGYSW